MKEATPIYMCQARMNMCGVRYIKTKHLLRGKFPANGTLLLWQILSINPILSCNIDILSIRSKNQQCNVLVNNFAHSLSHSTVDCPLTVLLQNPVRSRNATQ